MAGRPKRRARRAREARSHGACRTDKARRISAHAVLAAMPPGELLYLPTLGRSLGADPVSFREALVDLRENGKIALHHHDHPRSLSDSDRAYMPGGRLVPGTTCYSAASRR